jgi:hypothetical protein
MNVMNHSDNIESVLYQLICGMIGLLGLGVGGGQCGDESHSYQAP